MLHNYIKSKKTFTQWSNPPLYKSRIGHCQSPFANYLFVFSFSRYPSKEYSDTTCHLKTGKNPFNTEFPCEFFGHLPSFWRRLPRCTDHGQSLHEYDMSRGNYKLTASQQALFLYCKEESSQARSSSLILTSPMLIFLFFFLFFFEGVSNAYTNVVAVSLKKRKTQ